VSAKQIDVGCPCCDARLTVDVGTAMVLRWRSAEELAAEAEGGDPEASGASRWDSALGRVSQRGERGKDAFDDALKKERSREEDLDRLFREANERTRPKEDA
jgi:hypothetical protein